MSDSIIPFDFEERAVRVVMRGEDPWFVAADVCRILELSNPSMAVSVLDEDERNTVNLNTLSLTEGIRGNPNATIISEGGLYTLILRSREAVTPGTTQHRFRKWVTGDLLPTLRKTGRYEMPSTAQPVEDAGMADYIAGMPERTFTLHLRAIEVVRNTRGRAAADALMSELLPMLDGPAPRAGGRGAAQAADGIACLRHVLTVQVDGNTVGDWIGIPTRDASRALARLGLRSYPGNGLFIANQPHAALFHGTKWSGGLHMAPLRAIPGAKVAGNPLSFEGRRARGVIVPLFAEVSHAA